MPQNDMSGSISYKQEKLIEKLIGEGKEGDSPLYEKIVNKQIELKDLSAGEASELITELTAQDESDPTLAGYVEGHAAADAQPRAPGPMTPEQAQYIHDLLKKKALVVEGQVNVEHLMSRLNASTASSLIDAFKYIPKLDAASQ